MHCPSSHPVILGLPGEALLLRVAWMERHDFRTKPTEDLVSPANSSVMNLLIPELISLVNNAHNQFAGNQRRRKSGSARGGRGGHGGIKKAGPRGEVRSETCALLDTESRTVVRVQMSTLSIDANP